MNFGPSEYLTHTSGNILCGVNHKNGFMNSLEDLKESSNNQHHTGFLNQKLSFFGAQECLPMSLWKYFPMSKNICYLKRVIMSKLVSKRQF